jgi:hypothetical protein
MTTPSQGSVPPIPPSPPKPGEPELPEHDRQFLTYRSNRVPWFIHILWFSFWVLAIWYVLRYQFPALPIEIRNPP